VLATNKLSSVFGTAVARRHTAGAYAPTCVPRCRWRLPPASVRQEVPACARLIPREVFRPLVLALLVLVAGYTLLRPRIGDAQALRFAGGGTTSPLSPPRRRSAATTASSARAPGASSSSPSSGCSGTPFLQASAKARIVNLATNIGALAVFVPQGRRSTGWGC
jgi:hypothetical protein